MKEKLFYAFLISYFPIGVLVWAYQYNRIPQDLPERERHDLNAEAALKANFWPLYLLGKAALCVTKP